MKRPLSFLSIGLAAMGLLFPACHGDGTTSKEDSTTLKEFAASACKKEAAQTARQGEIELYALALSDPRYDGLKCILWDVAEDGQARIDLYNFESACGPTWDGQAETLASNGLRLSAVNSRCMIAACGSCIYDWSFKVSGVSTGSDLPLDIEVVVCPEKPEDTKTFQATLPVKSAAKGVLCRYADPSALDWMVMSNGQQGKLHMPCGKSMTGADVACDPGLSCQPGATEQAAVCLKVCTSDSDCSLPGVLACSDGFCRIKQTW